MDFNKKDISKEAKTKEVVIEKANWKNLGLSFVYAFVPYLIYLGMIVNFVNVEIVARVLGIGIPMAVFVALSRKFETDKYQLSSGIFGTVVGITIFGPIAGWAFTYDILQIKDGIYRLKSDNVKQKQSKIIMFIWSFVVVLVILAAIYLIELERRNISEILKCDNADVQQGEVIPLLNKTFEEHGYDVEVLSLYDANEIEYNSENGSRTCRSLANFSTGEKAIVEYAFVSENGRDFKVGVRILDILK